MEEIDEIHEPTPYCYRTYIDVHIKCSSVVTATGRALFTYPMNGQTLQKENADRAACHDWAVAQTGFDPSLVYAAQQAGVSQRTISNATREWSLLAV